MFAVVEINGFQYNVKENEVIQVSKMNDTEKGNKVEFDKVLFIKDEADILVGKPFIDGAKVICEHAGDIKGKKVVVMKFKRRKDYKRIKGHRQDYALIKVEKIIRP